MTTTTPSASNMRAYSISTKDQASIDVWVNEHIRPSILVQAPMRDVGERELVEDLFQASYRLQGFRDARRRHFISRKLPQALSDAAFARFRDQAFDASEVSDGFHGVDTIDLSDWLDCNFFSEDLLWQEFISYIQEHPETDFVFLAYGDATAAKRLASSISASSGNAVLFISLNHPTPEQLADAFVAQNPELFDLYRDDIVSHLSEGLAEAGNVGYAAIRSAAVAAAHSASISHGTWQAIRDALAQAVGTKANGAIRIGFMGGER